jgi:hypothetical protein
MTEAHVKRCQAKARQGMDKNMALFFSDPPGGSQHDLHSPLKASIMEGRVPVRVLGGDGGETSLSSCALTQLLYHSRTFRHVQSCASKASLAIDIPKACLSSCSSQDLHNVHPLPRSGCIVQDVQVISIHLIDIETLLFGLKESCVQSLHIISSRKIEEEVFGNGRGLSCAFGWRLRHEEEEEDVFFAFPQLCRGEKARGRKER